MGERQHAFALNDRRINQMQVTQNAYNDIHLIDHLLFL